MTADRNPLAAEYALGLLTGKPLAQARALHRSDLGFKAEVAGWNARLAPLLAEVAPVEPAATTWQRIERELGRRAASAAANDNADLMRRSRDVWRGMAATMSTVAAALALVLVLRPAETIAPAPGPSGPSVAAVPAGAPMVARVGDDSGVKLVANWDPARKQLILTIAGTMPEDSGKSHELWVIPRDQTPISLGTMSSGELTRKELADALAKLMQDGATIAVTVEPMGGSPSGAPTGPVIAAGPLKPV